MSLRIFHVIFIVICIALCVSVAIWGVREYEMTRNAGALGMTATFVVAGIILVAYSGRAFRKLRDL